MVSRLLYHNNKNVVRYGALIFVLGLLMTFLVDTFLMPNILMVLGIEVVVLELLRKYLIKKASIKILGYTILAFSVLNFLRHSLFFVVITRIRALYEDDPWFHWFLTKEVTWFIVSVWILFRGLNLLFPKEDVSFMKYIDSREFKILIVLIIILFVLEIPMFGIHGNFGGYPHGHAFWDASSHLH